MSIKDPEKLTAKEALSELKTLSQTVDFEEARFDKDTPLPELQKLVKEGREILKESGLATEDGSNVPPLDTSEEPPAPRISRRTTPQAATRAPEDYLQKYQYRKGTESGSKQSNPQPGSRAEIMKKQLLTQPRIETMIPAPEGEAPGTRYSINLNGYRLDLPKNTYISIPKQIAEHIRSSQKQLQEAHTRIEAEHGLERSHDGMKAVDVL